MATDLTGGLRDEREYVFSTQPTDPEMRESVNAWIWDDGVVVGMPRIGVEAVGDQWDTHDVQVNIAYADGRIFNIFSPGKVHAVAGPDGGPRVLGAGPLSFELIEPFRHWRMRLEGLAVETSIEEQIAGAYEQQAVGRVAKDPSVEIGIDIDIRSAVPPWEQGKLLPEAARVLAEQEEGAMMGGPRFEQLSRVTGTLRIGNAQHDIRGGALRVRRQGVRRTSTFRGHAWQSALFPSGRGFGYIVYPPREDGVATYNEGYLFEGDGELVPAWVVRAPWLRTLQSNGEDVSVVLETEKGTTTIAGESIISTFSGVIEGLGSPVLHQAIARYTWEGETANGMMERSTRADQLQRPS